MFMSALRQLFDILDEKNSGFIKLSDLETRWKAVETDPKVPKGLIDCLQSVQTANELIDFESFCEGIKMCLHNASSVSHAPSHDHLQQCPEPNYVNGNISAEMRVRSLKESVYSSIPASYSSINGREPDMDYYRLQRSDISPAIREIPRNIGMIPPSASSTTNTPSFPLPVSLKSHSFDDMCQENSRLDSRTKSMPQLKYPNNQSSVVNGESNDENFRHFNSDPKLLDSGKVAAQLNPSKVPMRSKIINLLKDWRNSVIQKGSSSTLTSSAVNTESGTEAKNVADSVADNEWGFQTSEGSNTINAKKSALRRREVRRHTVSYGVDINTIKRLQQCEQEKELYLQGLEMVERAREWYLKNIANIQAKLRLIGQVVTGHGEYSLDANQERINFQAARIFHVNQHLASLMDTSKGFPIHMNLAVKPMTSKTYLSNHEIGRQEALNNATIRRLKEQNRLLTEEVGIKSEKITVLEREKSALIRQLFQSQSSSGQKSASNEENDDNAFM